MTAVVLEVYNSSVLIKTDWGSIMGRWCSHEPIRAKKYILELDCDDIVSPESVQESLSNEPYIMNYGDKVILCGKVEEIEDGVMFVRVGEDLLMLNILLDSEYKKYINQYVNITLSCIQFYDTGLC